MRLESRLVIVLFYLCLLGITRLVHWSLVVAIVTETILPSLVDKGNIEYILPRRRLGFIVMLSFNACRVEITVVPGSSFWHVGSLHCVDV